MIENKMIIQVKNKKWLCLFLVAIIIFLSTLPSVLELDPVSELTLIILILWIISLFIKLEVKK